MRERASLVAAIVVVLSGCDSMKPDPMPMAPSLDGTWYFAGFAATIAGESVTVTVGDGTTSMAGAVMITVDADADPNTITVAGSFIVALSSAFAPQPVTQVVGCKGTPCMAP